MHGRGGEACMAGWACMAGGLRGRGCVVVGGAWQEKRPLQRVVRILLECILVQNKTIPGFLSSY